MKPFTLMVRRVGHILRLKSAIVLLLLTMSAGCTKDSGQSNSVEYASPPRLIQSQVIEVDGDTLRPVRLQIISDTLFVAYAGIARIDVFNTDLEKIGSIPLTDPEPIFPTSFVFADSELVVCDHARRLIVVYDRQGRFLDSYGTLPDQATTLAPLAMTFYRGILYVSDMHLKKVMAISLAESPGVTERGELILTIPRNDSHKIGFPSAVAVTPDGRLLIGDAAAGRVQAFTCDGGFVYSFDSVASAQIAAIQGFAIDDVIDPALQDGTTFDPSGISNMGRIHVADANNGQIHMFNPIGKYIASYPTTKPLGKPSAIVFDAAGQRLFVADPGLGLLHSFKLVD